MSYLNRSYIENGTSIRPDWTDRIAISNFPHATSSITGSFITMQNYDIGGVNNDLSGRTLNITPILIANKFWQLYNADNSVYNTEIIKDIYIPQEGIYQVYFSKTAGGDIVFQLYFGNVGGRLMYSINTAQGNLGKSNNESNVNVLINPDVGAITFTGKLIYSRNVYLSGTTTQIVTANTDGLRLRNTSLLSKNEFNQMRFYIKELGCYTLGNDNAYITYEHLTADYTLKKSDIKTIIKQNVPGNIVNGRVYDPIRKVILINNDRGDITFKMGSVLNKEDWTDSLGGLENAYNEVSNWMM